MKSIKTIEQPHSEPLSRKIAGEVYGSLSSGLPIEIWALFGSLQMLLRKIFIIVSIIEPFWFVLDIVGILPEPECELSIEEHIAHME